MSIFGGNLNFSLNGFLVVVEGKHSFLWDYDETEEDKQWMVDGVINIINTNTSNADCQYWCVKNTTTGNQSE